jgi:RIO kinase 1
MNGRARRAIASHSQKGREFEQREWIAWEWQTLSRLHSVGASVPEPVARSSIAILMELIGDEGEGAPKLVHGDLSAYNVLWHDDRPRIIDVPQAIDLHGRPDGFGYFDRDVSNLERYFARYGLSARDFALRTWERYQRGQLGR